MFEELYRLKKLNPARALEFGFKKCGESYEYSRDILDGMFHLNVIIAAEGRVDTALVENETGDEYVMYKVNSAGAFAGTVREAVEEVLMEVVEKCFYVEVFKSAQAKEIISYVRGKYGDELEFLWKKFPENAVWRRRENGKWYGAILTVAGTKLGLKDESILEIIDLKAPPEKITELISKKNYYPGWHMNKKHWFTIVLDGSVSTEEILKHIDESYLLA